MSFIRPARLRDTETFRPSPHTADGGYSPGEQEAIAAWLAAHKPEEYRYPGFGSGLPITTFQDIKRAKNGTKARSKVVTTQDIICRERRAVIKELYTADHGEGYTLRMAHKLGISPSTVSGHIRALRKAGEIS